MVYPSNYQVLCCKLWTRETFECWQLSLFFSRTKTLPCLSCSFRLPHIDHERLQVAFINTGVRLGLDPSSAGCNTLGQQHLRQKVPFDSTSYAILNIRYRSIRVAAHLVPTTRPSVWRLDSGQGVLIWLNNKWWNWTSQLIISDIKIFVMICHDPSYVIAEHLANNEAQGTPCLNT